MYQGLETCHVMSRAPAAAAAFLLLLPCHHCRFDVFEVRAILVVIGCIMAVVLKLILNNDLVFKKKIN